MKTHPDARKTLVIHFVNTVLIYIMLYAIYPDPIGNTAKPCLTQSNEEEAGDAVKESGVVC